MLRLSRKDNIGFRSIVPGLYIALDRDQEAYDFLKWYATTGEAQDYDQGDISLGYLYIKGADALKAPLGSWIDNSWLELSHVAAITLVKVRVLLDLQALQNTRRALAGAVPNETTDLIRRQLVGSIVAARPDILGKNTEETAHLIENIKGQIRQLYKSTDKCNTYFWDEMLGDPDAAGLNRPNRYSPGSKEEAYITIGYSGTSWLGTPGAIDVIRGLKEKA